MDISQVCLLLSHFYAHVHSGIGTSHTTNRTAHHLPFTIFLAAWHAPDGTYNTAHIHTHTPCTSCIHALVNHLLAHPFCTLSIVFSLASQVADFGNVWSIIMFFSYGLERKVISLSLALKIPVALKLVNSQVFHLQASCNLESHYCGYTSSGPVTKIK